VPAEYGHVPAALSMPRIEQLVHVAMEKAKPGMIIGAIAPVPEDRAYDAKADAGSLVVSTE